VANYTIGTGNTAIAPYPGPYQELSISTTGTNTALVTFTSDTTGGFTYLMGDGGSVALNINATNFSFSGVTATGPFTVGTFSDGGAGQEDGFGSFNFSLNDTDGYPDAANMISFTITNLSGTWANAADVLTGNSLGNIAATHTFVCTAPCTLAAGALATGFASVGEGGGPPVLVPEPATLALVGLGLAIAGVARRRKQA
jgi:hypothetical protein